MTAIYRQFGQVPFSYANGLGLSNDATTPNSILDIAAGTILDSTLTFQMSLPTAITISNLTAGLNGLDTGAVAASTVYAVYLVGDPVTNQATGAILSKSLTGPLMPFGYSAYALLGYATTDSSKHFLAGYWTAGNTNFREFIYDAFQATAVTAGHATSYANVNLITLVPNLNNVPVYVYSSYVGATAGNALSLQAGNGVSAQAIVTCQVATIANTSVNTILAQPVSITSVLSPVINYKESNASDAVAIDVAGYQFFI